MEKKKHSFFKQRKNELQVYIILKLIRDMNALTGLASQEMGARNKDSAFTTLFS